ncbi:Toxin coregulated pilus biosynthesis protein E [Pandoraea terrae]|uniref:Toxin coregulated pilus biosynthesis protein E n=1 Tax=Pandoraea terrae TaxID=1537710 RepID=A0A5E4T7G5_9BURK|nr:type II secretion system F family protein [Pandoraea terrae]VVD83727.1 Toxin coregulated pilus biosynthesis protein E [Pandoraea terrae]
MLNRWLSKFAPRRAAYPGLPKAIRRFHAIRAKFYGDFADSIEDGANPYDLFSRRYIRARQRKDPLAPLYALWRDRASSLNLRKSWEGTIPHDDLLVVGAGERGDLPGTLRFLSHVVTMRNRNRAAITGAIALPAFLMIVLMGIQMGVAFGMMPIMTQVMPPEQFPLLGRGLYVVSGVIAHYWYAIYGLPILTAMAIAIALPRWTGPTRRRFDAIGPFSIYRDVRAGEFLVSLAALTEAKVSTFDAITMMMTGTRPWMRSHLMRMRASLKSDRSMTKAMDTGLFSEALFDRIAEYSERSNFEKGIRKIGLTALEEVADIIRQRSAVMKNVLIMLVGGFMVFTVGSMLQIGQQAGEHAASMM